jgi:hypothetical protein
MVLLPVHLAVEEASDTAEEAAEMYPLQIVPTQFPARETHG